MIDLIHRNTAIVEIVLNNPPANALGVGEVKRLRDVISTIQNDTAIKVAVFRAKGPIFCAGADIKMMKAAVGSNNSDIELADFAQNLQETFQKLAALPVCTIAALSGSAIGGGFELALSCDIRVIGLTSRCGFPEIRLGLIPAAGGTQLASELAGKATALRLILTGELLTATEAYRLNLVQFLKADHDVEPFAFTLAERIAVFPRSAIVANKRCIALSGTPMGYEEEISATKMLHGTNETRALISNFATTRHS